MLKVILKFKEELIMCSLVVGCVLIAFGDATIGGLLLAPGILYNVFND
jgi:hypothetical protein